MIGITLAATAVPVIGGLAWRRVRQRQVARALEITTPNRIVEQRFVRVGGIDQWIQLRGEDRDNPVLLVLHGGPGRPNAVFTLPLRPWEQHFTVVQWDHRGAGKTLRRNGKAGSAKGLTALEKIGADPARWDLGPGTPTWPGRSERTCPSRTWTAGCCSPWLCHPRSTPCGISTACS